MNHQERIDRDLSEESVRAISRSINQQQTAADRQMLADVRNETFGNYAWRKGNPLYPQEIVEPVEESLWDKMTRWLR